MSSVAQDLRYALRLLRKSPGFTLLAILTLALGIGANTTMFSVVNAVLLRPLPYPEPSRLVGFSTNQSWPDLEDVSRESRSLTHVCGAQIWPMDYLAGAEPEKVRAAVVTADLFSAFGARPSRGRGIGRGDDRPGADPVVVVSDGFWKSRLGGDGTVVGRKLVLGGQPFSVVGVMPPGFEVPRAPAEMWLPFRVVAAEAAPYRGAHLLRAFARLAPGVSMPAAQAELDAVAAGLKRVHPQEDKEQTFALQPLREQLVARSRTTVLLLFAAVVVVLLVACANFANLLLSRSARRARELAIRTALGAGRWRLIRQLLAESLVLALAGGAAGVLLAVWGQELLVKLSALPALTSGEIRLDWRVLAFSFGVSLATGILFGLVPAAAMAGAQAGRENLTGHGGAGFGSSRVARGLVVWEIAIALVLLNGAGLLFRGLSRLQSVDPGFAVDHRLTFRLDLPAIRYAEIAPRTRFFRSLLEHVSSIPRVKSAALVSEVPLQGPPLDHNVVVEGGPAYAPGEEPSAYSRTVSPGYFRTLGIPAVRGRDFTETDREDAPMVVIVNDAFVRQFFRGRDPIGGRIRWARDREKNWMTVVGVARDVRHLALADVDGPAVYAPYSQNKQVWKRWSSVVLWTDGDPGLVLPDVKAAVRALDPALPVTEVATLEQVLASATAAPGRRNLVLALFAALALTLALVGVYGVISQAVSRRTQEIGIRVALGARAADVLGLVVGQAFRLAFAGVVLGVAAAAVLARVFLAKLLFGVSAIDPSTYIAMAAAMLAAVLLASGLPARRAVKVDPARALRAQ